MQNITNYGEVEQEKRKVNMWKERQGVKDLSSGSTGANIGAKNEILKKIHQPW